MNYSLRYDIGLFGYGEKADWELHTPFSKAFRRCRWMAYYGNHSVDEFEKIRKAWAGNLSRDLDNIWYRTEISNE